MDQTRTFERYMAVVAALGCIVFTIAVWWSVSAVQPMWPLPALYLIEVVAVSAAAAIAFGWGGARGRGMAWGAVGLLLGFSLLGLFSVGALYLPTALILGIVCATADLRNKSPLGWHLVIFLLAALLQSALMLTLSHLAL